MSNECGWVNGFSLFFDLGARGDMWSVIEGERGKEVQLHMHYWRLAVVLWEYWVWVRAYEIEKRRCEW
jgi:hypothetical protein